MFGMPFGQSAPQNRAELADNEELANALVEAGIIGSGEVISSSDLEAMKARVAVLENNHVNHQVAPILAYIDRKVASEKALGNVGAEERLISKITTDIVSALVSHDLASNEEFLSTVLNLAKTKYQSGTGLAFSDALMEAIHERENQITHVPEVSGKIDANDNVLMGEDLKQ